MKNIHLKLILVGLVCMLIAGQPLEAQLLKSTSLTHDQEMILQARAINHHRHHCHGHVHHRHHRHGHVHHRHHHHGHVHHRHHHHRHRGHR